MTSEKQRRIVCVDDDPDLCQLIKVMLEPHNFEVIETHGGLEGITAIREEEPDLVLLDLMMPDMDGWELFRQMQQLAELKEIPVIVVTARSNRAERELGRIVGIDDYIIKPFTRKDLIERINKALHRGE